MIDLKWCVEFSFQVSALVLGAAGLFLIGSVSDLDRRLKRFYLGTILLLMILSLSVLALRVEKLSGSALWYERWVDCFQMLLYVPLFTALTAYLLHCSGEELRGNKTLVLVFTMRTLLFLQAFVFSVSGLSVRITTDTLGQYTVPLAGNLLISATALIVDTVILIRRWKKLTNRQRILFVACYFSLQFWMILLIELFILGDQNQRYLRQKEELAQQKTKVAVLQMRPHFIFNTLMSIYYLCQDDVAKAQQVILNFSKYLQANFTAVASEENIPFTKELEHTQAYLAVVKARYEGRLFVEYDTPVTMFCLPPLTLQPIVENAVKYGISPGLDPLYISVLTECADGGVRITVEDTGPGYSPADDQEPHFALDNIRERLKMMCSGTLEIARREAGGTKVTIWVPLHKPGTQQ